MLCESIPASCTSPPVGTCCVLRLRLLRYCQALANRRLSSQPTGQSGRRRSYGGWRDLSYHLAQLVSHLRLASANETTTTEQQLTLPRSAVIVGVYVIVFGLGNPSYILRLMLFMLTFALLATALLGQSRS